MTKKCCVFCSETSDLSHVDGVSYLFLHGIAENLGKLNKLVRVQAYDKHSKKPAPLVISAGSKPFPAAFLEGKIEGDKYLLVLHVSNRELKIPEINEIRIYMSTCFTRIYAYFSI